MYFTYITQEYVPKNNLQKALLEKMREYNRVLVKEDDVKEFKTRISSTIIDCNVKHPKCAGIHPDWWNSSFKEKDIRLSLPMLHMVFYKVESGFEV